MSYGILIKQIRNKKNMSLRAFGKLVDVDYSHLARLEKEESTKGKERLNPSIDILKQICDRTGYPFRTFLEEAGYIEVMEQSLKAPTASRIPQKIINIWHSLSESEEKVLINIIESYAKTTSSYQIDKQSHDSPNTNS